ncbi:MAG: hypothetical protein V8T45_02460 [Oscillospiraceae bacterium]
MDQKWRLPLWAAAAAKDMDFVPISRKPRIKAQRSGFDSEKEEQGSEEVFGKRRSLLPETELSGLCSDVTPRAQ